MNLSSIILSLRPPIRDDAGKDVALQASLRESLTLRSRGEGSRGVLGQRWQAAREGEGRGLAKFGRVVMMVLLVLVVLAPSLLAAGLLAARMIAMGRPRWLAMVVFVLGVFATIWLFTATKPALLELGGCMRIAVLRLVALRCGACGYDLDVSHEDEVGLHTCPECGAAWDLASWKKDFPAISSPSLPKDRVFGHGRVMDRRGRVVAFAPMLSGKDSLRLWGTMSARQWIGMVLSGRRKRGILGPRMGPVTQLLKLRRCPCCMMMLTRDPARDGNTVCDGCGAAWLVPADAVVSRPTTSLEAQLPKSGAPAP